MSWIWPRTPSSVEGEREREGRREKEREREKEEEVRETKKDDQERWLSSLSSLSLFFPTPLCILTLERRVQKPRRRGGRGRRGERAPAAV